MCFCLILTYFGENTTSPKRKSGWICYFRHIQADKDNHFLRICLILGGGGHSHWKGVWGCAAVMTPFFQASCRSLAYQFTVNAPLLWPPFSIFRKILDFQPWFGQNSSSLDPNFSKFSFLRPPFSRKIRSLDPTFWNLRDTHPPKKVECPPPGIWWPVLLACA